MNELITTIDAGIGLVGEVTNATSGTAHPQAWFFEALSGGGQSDSGEVVNPKTSLRHGPVWQAVNILAGDVGQLPLHVYRKKGRNRERDTKHPVDWLLSEPNPYQTAAIWKETMMAWALLWGNGCSAIFRDGAGRPVMLVPLAPDRTKPLAVEGEWFIETEFDGKRVPIPYEDVFHLRGLADDGFWGLSAVEVCKNTIGHGMALLTHGNKTFKNGARPSGVLASPDKAPPADVREEYRAQWEKLHQGSDNTGRVLFLYGGTTFAPMSMSNEDAQWLDARKQDPVAIAGLFGLPPYKLGAMENSAVRANLEQQNTDYLTTSLSRHLNKIKEEAERKFLPQQERRSRTVYLKWIVEAFLRGDLAARGAYYSQAKTGEWLTTNEIRELEDMNPIDGGDVLKNPAINPAQAKPASEPVKRSDEPTPPSEAAPAARVLVAQQIGALLEAEAKAAVKACNPETSKNVVRWAESYYENYQKAAAHFLEQPCKIAAAVGCGPCDWRRAVCDHARDSLNRLLAMTGIATAASLPEIGAGFAESVRDRKEQLTKTVLGE